MVPGLSNRTIKTQSVNESHLFKKFHRFTDATTTVAVFEYKLVTNKFPTTLGLSTTGTTFVCENLEKYFFPLGGEKTTTRFWDGI